MRLDVGVKEERVRWATCRIGWVWTHDMIYRGRGDVLVIASAAGFLWNRFENNRLGRGSSSRECDKCQCSECELHVFCFELKQNRTRGEGQRKGSSYS